MTLHSAPAVRRHRPGKATDYSILLDYHEGRDGISFHLRRPSMRYLDELVQLRCGADLLALGIYPNAKEVTESFACVNAARRLLGDAAMKDPTWTCVVVGDGSTPRTGAAFAFRTKWSVWSVDPGMRDGFCTDDHGVSRLSCIGEKIEDVAWTVPNWEKLLIVCPHSHVSLPAVLAALPAKERHVIAIPCCVEQWLETAPPYTKYDDWGIWSPERAVYIWKDV